MEGMFAQRRCYVEIELEKYMICEKWNRSFIVWVLMKIEKGGGEWWFKPH